MSEKRIKPSCITVHVAALEYAMLKAQAVRKDSDSPDDFVRLRALFVEEGRAYFSDEFMNSIYANPETREDIFNGINAFSEKHVVPAVKASLQRESLKYD